MIVSNQVSKNYANAHRAAIVKRVLAQIPQGRTVHTNRLHGRYNQEAMLTPFHYAPPFNISHGRQK